MNRPATPELGLKGRFPRLDHIGLQEASDSAHGGTVHGECVRYSKL